MGRRFNPKALPEDMEGENQARFTVDDDGKKVGSDALDYEASGATAYCLKESKHSINTVISIIQEKSLSTPTSQMEVMFQVKYVLNGKMMVHQPLNLFTVSLKIACSITASGE